MKERGLWRSFPQTKMEIIREILHPSGPGIALDLGEQFVQGSEGEWAEVAPSPTSQYPEHRCVMITRPPGLTDHQPMNCPSALEGEYPVSPRSFGISTDFAIEVRSEVHSLG